MKVWILQNQMRTEKTNAGGSFETQNFFFLASVFGQLIVV